jgi:hypothetical protein
VTGAVPSIGSSEPEFLYSRHLPFGTVSSRYLPSYHAAMFTRKRSALKRTAYSVAIVILSSAAPSRAQSQASAPMPSMDDLMQAVHDYGRGHQSSVLPPPSPLPQEPEKDYRAKIDDLILASNFSELEKVAQQNRLDRGLLLGGAWKNYAFYDQLANPPGTLGKSAVSYQGQVTRLNQWIAAYPDSATPRIGLARLYVNYAFFARGTEYADSVSDFQWNLYSQRTVRAARVLLEAAQLKDRDPQWYEGMQQVAFAVGWDRGDELDLLNQAVAFEPSYYHFYREYTQFLKPQWYGAPGEIAQFAKEASAKLPEPESSILYFRIASSLACTCDEQVAGLPTISWPKFKSGYFNLTQLYGKSNLYANRFAFVAFMLKEKDSTQQAFTAIDTMEDAVWTNPRTFEIAREWSNRP